MRICSPKEPIRCLVPAGFLILALTGCGVFRRQRPQYVRVADDVKVGSVTVEELEQRLLDFADTYTQRLAQAYLEIEEEATTPEVRKWAHKAKMTSAMSAYDIATGRNPVANMFNMIVLVELNRIVMKEYWIPEKFPEAGDELLPFYRQTSEEAWRLAEGILSENQKEDLQGLILDWRRQNPNQQIVALIRFDDFAAVRAMEKDPRKGGVGSIFNLFYLDPLANLDPIAREVYYTRLFAERAFFYGQRMPTLLVGQAKGAYYDVVSTPEFQGFLEDIDTFSHVSVRFADSFEQFSDQVAKEREAAFEQASALVEKERTAAIDQIAEKVGGEREAFLTAMESQQSQIRDLLAESRATAAEARETIAGAVELATSANIAILSLDDFVTGIQEEGRRKEASGDSGRPFDITEYSETAIRLGEAARELNETVKSLDALVANPQLTGEDSVVVRSLDRAERVAEGFVDRAFRSLLILLIVLLVGLPTALFGYRYAVHRSLRLRTWPSTSSAEPESGDSGQK